MIFLINNINNNNEERCFNLYLKTILLNSYYRSIQMSYSIIYKVGFSCFYKQI